MVYEPNLESPPSPSDSEPDNWKSETGHGKGARLGDTYRLEKLHVAPESSQDVGDLRDREFTVEKAGRRARRTSDETEQSFMLYTPDEERSVVNKFDRRLVLFIALLYMLSFLDRSSMILISSTRSYPPVNSQ